MGQTGSAMIYTLLTSYNLIFAVLFFYDNWNWYFFEKAIPQSKLKTEKLFIYMENRWDLKVYV